MSGIKGENKIINLNYFLLIVLNVQLFLKLFIVSHSKTGHTVLQECQYNKNTNISNVQHLISTDFLLVEKYPF